MTLAADSPGSVIVLSGRDRGRRGLATALSGRLIELIHGRPRMGPEEAGFAVALGLLRVFAEHERNEVAPRGGPPLATGSMWSHPHEVPQPGAHVPHHLDQ